MKKQVLLLVILMICGLLIGGCGKKAESQPPAVDSNQENSMDQGTPDMTAMTGEGQMPPMGMDSANGAMPGKMMKKKEVMSEGSGYPVTITDLLGNTVTLEQKPEKIAAISGTFLGLLYSVGGTSICTAELSGGSPAPAGAEDLPRIGQVYNPNIEKILELQPDLVIAQFGLQNSVVPALQQSRIPVITLQMQTYEDVVDKLKIMGRIVGMEAKADELVQKMSEEKEAILDRLPAKAARVVILYVTSQDISVKLENSIAGNVAEILGLENIAAGSKPAGMGGDSTPFSMETIVEKDPDVILVTSMLSDSTSSQKVIEEKLGNDPIWKELRAVKERRIVYLPQKYFLFNAGADFVEGIAYMAKGVYPEIYGDLHE